MKKTNLFTALAIMTGSLAATTASAQIQWTTQQKEIWKTETTISDLATKGDWQDFFSYFDDNFENWGPNSHIPVPKTVFQKTLEYYISQGGKYDLHMMVPVNIWVNGNYAYVDYYDAWIIENKEGKKTDGRGRNLDVLLKKGDKWVLVASMTQNDPADK